MSEHDPVFGFLERRGFKPSDRAVTFTGDEARVIPAGARNDTLTALAGMFHKMNLAPNMLAAALRGIATDPASVADTDYEDGEIDRIVEHISNRGSTAFDTRTFRVSKVTPQEKTKPLVWLVPGVIPNEGLTLLFGLPAQGKSWVALDLCVACLTGGVWVNGETAKKISRIAYFDWERRGEMFKRRLTKLAGDKRLTIDYIECFKPLADSIDDMKELILANGYEFAVIDSLSIAIMTADLMSASEIIPRMFALHEMGIPILMLDHQKKPQGNESPAGGSAFGSMFKEAVVSCAWQAIKVDHRVYTPGHMDFRLMHKKNNFDISPTNLDLTLTIDDEAGTVSLGVLQDTPRITKILDALSHRDEMTLAEIAGVVGGISDDTIRKDLEDPRNGLVAQGAVIITTPGGSGRGNARKYALDRWPNSDRPDGNGETK